MSYSDHTYVAWFIALLLLLSCPPYALQLPRMHFDLLPELQFRAKRGMVLVRVYRKWEYRSGSDAGPVQNIDMVFVDEMGNSMHAEIPQEFMEVKGPLVQGGIYVISRFSVSNCPMQKNSYHVVPGRLMIEFTYHTRVDPARDPCAFPKYAYHLTPFPELPSYVGENKNFLDVIGLIVQVGEPTPVQLPNQPNGTVIRDVVLRDLKTSPYCILWLGCHSTRVAELLHLLMLLLV